jgi:hypothetical protein
MKLLGINSVGFDVTDKPLFKFTAFVRVWNNRTVVALVVVNSVSLHPKRKKTRNIV